MDAPRRSCHQKFQLTRTLPIKTRQEKKRRDKGTLQNTISQDFSGRFQTTRPKTEIRKTHLSAARQDRLHQIRIQRVLVGDLLAEPPLRLQPVPHLVRQTRAAIRPRRDLALDAIPEPEDDVGVRETHREVQRLFGERREFGVFRSERDHFGQRGALGR